MAEPSQTSSNQKPSQVSLAFLLGWFLPGAGHLLTRHYVRALLLFLAISTLWWIGLAMDGHIFLPGGTDSFGTLGFIGDLGSGLYFLLAYLAGWGRDVVTVDTADYGTKFIVVASLLNIVAAVDAHNLRIGRKRSYTVETVELPVSASAVNGATR